MKTDPTAHQSDSQLDGQAESEGVSQDTLDQEMVDQLKTELQQARQAEVKAKESELRSMADYHNLVRRTQEDRAKLVKFANRELIIDLLQPLDHLSLAAQQLNDAGLTMTLQQLWKVLNEYGVEEINPVNQAFDVNLMEVVETQGEGETVITVVKKGYKLNGEVIQHAKVIVGSPIN